MPQMMPLYWILMTWVLICTLITIIAFIYFFLIPTPSNFVPLKHSNLNYPNIKHNWVWKW